MLLPVSYEANYNLRGEVLIKGIQAYGSADQIFFEDSNDVEGLGFELNLKTTPIVIVDESPDTNPSSGVHDITPEMSDTHIRGSKFSAQIDDVQLTT